MSVEEIPGTDRKYGLIAFDADGQERPTPSGLMSQTLIDKAASEPITNVFFFCHGWKGDLPAAKDQYGRWMKALVTSSDMDRAAQVFPGFNPLFIGLHWPSLPWGDEELRGGGAFAAGGGIGPEALLGAYLERLGDRPAIRAPLEIILNEARRNAAPDTLPPHVRQAYLDLNSALGLGSEGVAAAPDADREGFDPDDSYDAGNEEETDFGGGLDLGGILGPLRQLSYWTMKKRARTVGEGGMHTFLKSLQQATASKGTRIHLMGHSFGTIVISGMLGGPNATGTLPRPVDSTVLVQGAVSLWSYADAIPFGSAGRGYFNRLLGDGKVAGPLVITQSRWDSAVGVLYPLASRIKGSADFGAGLPEYGAIGAYGIQGLSGGVATDSKMLPASGVYNFQKRKVYNLDGSQFIAKKEGASGAHSDIAGPEVAHVIWEAAFASA
ncbi:MAG: hypothetical protein ABI647_05690 [Gemmatimonadota bacterium]